MLLVKFFQNLNTGISQLISDNNAWFGSHCKIARRKYHEAKKKYNKNKTAENKRLLNLLSKEYKCTMNRYINKCNHGKEFYRNYEKCIVRAQNNIGNF